MGLGQGMGHGPFPTRIRRGERHCAQESKHKHHDGDETERIEHFPPGCDTHFCQTSISCRNTRVQRKKAFDNGLIDRTAMIQRTRKQKCDGHHGSSEKPRLEHPSRARRTGTTPAEPVYPVTDDPEAAV